MAVEKVFVTVGMGRWPFDRLIRAIDALVDDYEVFAQTGTSRITPRCPHAAAISPDEFDRRLAEADVVITHGGNTVRVAQRAGHVPICVAREPDRNETGNDHQIRFLAWEQARSPLLVLGGDSEQLAGDLVGLLVDFDLVSQPVRSRPLPPVVTDEVLTQRVSAVFADLPGAANPLAGHHERRFPWAYAQLAHLEGPHLDLGCGHGVLVDALHRHSARAVIGADPAADELAHAASPGLALVRIGAREPLPFTTESFTSVSALEVLEHVWDQDAFLAEIRRVLVPGGVLVVTVPRKHALSALDPDNAKYRFPRLHRFVYSRTFGAESYRRRFVDLSDGMRGDLAVERDEHHQYTEPELACLLEEAGFDPHAVDAANLWWRLFDIPRLLLPPRWQPLTYPLLRWDGARFHRANLFMAATKRSAPLRR